MANLSIMVNHPFDHASLAIPLTNNTTILSIYDNYLQTLEPIFVFFDGKKVHFISHQSFLIAPPLLFPPLRTTKSQRLPPPDRPSASLVRAVVPL